MVSRSDTHVQEMSEGSVTHVIKTNQETFVCVDPEDRSILIHVNLAKRVGLRHVKKSKRQRAEKTNLPPDLWRFLRLSGPWMLDAGC